MLRQKIGRFLSKGALGNQSITDLDFEPKIVLFWMNEQSGTGIALNSPIGFGAAVSATERFYSFSACKNNTTNSRRKDDDTRCIGIVDIALGSVIEDADFVQMLPDGFEIDWQNSDATQRVVDYTAIGGDDLENVKIKYFQGGNTGNQNVLGIGFQPDIVLSASTVHIPPIPAQDAYCLMTIGLSDASQNFCNGLTASLGWNEKHWSRSDSCIHVMSLTTTSVLASGSITAMLPDGFTINWNPGNGYGYGYFAICLKSPKLKIGSGVFKTSIGKQFYNTGHSTKGLLLFTSRLQDSNFSEGSTLFNAGGSDAANEFTRFVDRNIGAPTYAKQLNKTDRILSMIDITTDAITDDATLDSYKANGFDFDWKVTSGVAFDFHYLSFASENPTPPPPPPPILKKYKPSIPTHLLYQGDLKITIDKNGADMIFIGGQPVQDLGLENTVLISLFTRKDWCGNALIRNINQRIGSRFEMTCNQPITIAMLNAVRNAALNALDWMVSTNLVSEIDVRVSNPNGLRLETLVAIAPPGKDIEVLKLTKNGLNWIYQKMYPAHQRI